MSIHSVTNAAESSIDLGDDVPVSYSYRLPATVSDNDIEVARKILAFHLPQDWPEATICCNDRLPHPCSLRRWAIAVLYASNMSSNEVDGAIFEAVNA